MRRHTTVDLDTDLIGEAKKVLGTRQTTETIHAALSEVIRAHQRARLLELDTDLSLEDLDRMRAPRFPVE
ncbi:MAG: type II toxin-antitoxin system VapB family antitoxin [Candidatus Limnocylindria bacterium]